ncbi:MAG: molybdopterin synthase sulfur carrier subunit [Cytophagales bacterium CG18_big_fil_WC_8_21_14_2_50_42_9]|nr:MAG: molybdopterin synthase sulfur carrier subunit [Cytophagales bacterium CG18_big_fil_WC_8_21_14_2_50_42_9]
MQVKIALFGITKEIIGSSKLNYELGEKADVTYLLEKLKSEYPSLKKLSSLLIAVNDEYAEPEQVISEHDEIALIPPVCGG